MDLPRSLWPLLHQAAAAEQWPPSSDAAADLLVARAGSEGLLPLLFAAKDLPQSVARACERHRALLSLYRRRCETLLGTVGQIPLLLAGEPFLFVKGCDYMYRLYDEPLLRPMQDIDVLVPADRMQAVCRRLEQAVLSRPPDGPAERVASHHERGFFVNGITLEIHQAFLQPARHTIDYRAIFERRVALCTPQFQAFRLDDADAVAYAGLTMAMDQFASRLVRYVDLWLLLRSPGILEQAVARAREWRAVRALYGALHQVGRAFPEAVTPAWSKTAEALLPSSTRRFLERFVLPKQVPSRLGARPLQIWRKFWLIDGPAQRIGFGLHHSRSLIAGWCLAWRDRSAQTRAGRLP